MDNLIASFSVSKVFVWSFNKLSSLQKLVSLNDYGVCGVFGDFNGPVKGVLSGIADEISDEAFKDSRETVYGSRGVFNKANGVPVGQLVRIRNRNCLHKRGLLDILYCLISSFD